MFPFNITTKSEQRETRDQIELVLLSFVRAMVLKKPLIKHLNRILINSHELLLIYKVILMNFYPIVKNTRSYGRQGILFMKRAGTKKSAA